MKFALLVGDGMADYPLDALGGATPLAIANTPHMDRLAREGTIGIVRTIPDGAAPGSDIANLNLLGYDSDIYYTGRAPLEAVSRGIKLADNEVAFRCNLVTVDDGIMIDYSAGHITSDEAAELVTHIDRHLGDAHLKFYPGISYRHLMVARDSEARQWDTRLDCTPPHDIVGQPIEAHLPRGDDAQYFRKLMADSVDLLSQHPVNRKRSESHKRPANMIWLWGQGRRPSMPTFPELYGLSGAVISAVDLIRGIGVCAGFSIVHVPGATGYFDTDYSAKARYGLDALKSTDFLFIHVEAPDEAGHVGDIAEKIRAIENFDNLVVGPIADGIAQYHPHRVMVLPDHYTPIAVKTHVADPVPFVVWGSGVPKGNARGFTEAEAVHAHRFVEKGSQLLPAYLRE
ncbi:MAG: cofactor-independent phosphoglycerate mutase [Candidatus Abyssubacteria bacterium]